MENNNKSGNNFLSIFLLGAIVGAAIVFLWGTKKGKRILKIISEKGMDNVSNLLEKAEKAADLDEIFDEEDKGPYPIKTSEPRKNLIQDEFIAREKIAGEKPKVRRFFRGISRHVN